MELLINLLHAREAMRRFARDQNGAVTVDWVVLTAALIGLAIAALMQVGGATVDLSNGIANVLSALQTGTTN